jgi:hypothetical protein
VGEYARASVPTEITFSDEESPSVDPLRSRAEPTAPSEVAKAAEQERVAPASSTQASIKPQADSVEPLASETAKPEAIQPTQTAALTPEKMQPAPATPQPAKAVPSATPERVTGSQAEPVQAVGADAVKPVGTGEAVAANRPEREAAPTAGEKIAAAQTPERLAAPPSPAGTAAALPGEAAERIAAQDKPLGVGSSPAIAADQQKPEPVAGEAAESTAPAEDAAPVGGGAPAEKLAALQAPESVGAAPASDGLKPATAGQGSSAAETGATSESLQPVAPVSTGTRVSSAAPTGPAQPLAPSAETVTGTAPEALQPSGDASGQGAGSGSSGPTVRETVQPVERPIETALLVPARPNSVLGTEVDQPTDRYRRIVDFIRGYSGGDCFIALPAMDPNGVVTFQTFGRNKAREDEFRHALGAVDALKTEISSGDVADPQCLALSFARETKRYPGFSLVIDLNESDMASGTKLSGKVLNAKGRDLHLLLVDDEGTVQSIDSFLSAGEGTDRPFSVPLTLTGGKPVATKQILIAIATDPPLWGLDKITQPAADFFRELATQVEASHADVDLAVEGFNVR